MDFEDKLNVVKTIFLGVIMIGVIVISESLENPNYNYDVNRDGKVTAQDYVLIKNYIMEEE